MIMDRSSSSDNVDVVSMTMPITLLAPPVKVRQALDRRVYYTVKYGLILFGAKVWTYAEEGL